MIPFIVAGLTAGAVYSLAGVGLVLTYRVSGIFNFAYGALATLGAYGFYTLQVERGVPWVVAALVIVVVVGPAVGIVLELLSRAVVRAQLAIDITANVGVLLAIQGIIVLVYGQSRTRFVPDFLPAGHVRVGGTNIQFAELITFALAVVAAASLYTMMRWTRIGLAMRGVVDDPDLLSLGGRNPVAVRRWAWIIGSAFAMASGVLFAPVLPLDPALLTLLVVNAFGAAALGRFTSLPWTFAGGLIIGIGASIATKYFTSGVLAGIPASLPFIVLFVVLLTLPGSDALGRRRTTPPTSPCRTPLRRHVVAGGVVLAGLAIVPTFAGTRLTDWTVMLGMVMLLLSLGLLVKDAGLVSLGHVAFAAIGAVSFSHLTTDSGLPWLLALVVTGAIAIPIGALLALPAVRLPGLYLAIATFGFAYLMRYMFYTADFMFGSAGGGLVAPRPELGPIDLRGDTAFYFVVLAAATGTSLLVVAVLRTRLGRLLRGGAESPAALLTSGASIAVSRLITFCLSAVIATLAGAFIAMAQRTVSLTSYEPLLSLMYVATVVIVLGSAPWYALAGAMALVLVPAYLSGETTTPMLQVLFGVFAIGHAFTTTTTTVRPPRWLRRTRARVEVAPSGPPPTEPRGEAVLAGADLHADRLSVHFGGLVAVSEVSLLAPAGRITGLIGPNGAGKTTFFNACSGLARISEGRVLFDGHDISRERPGRRAGRGLGRTFQLVETFESQTVWDNVSIGIEGRLAGSNPLAHLVARAADHELVRARTAEALEICDLTPLAQRRVGTLSTGQQRLVELARCLAGGFLLLLLDEPSSGLDQAETRRFGEILRDVVAARGIGVLLVEHDMSLVMGICDEIYVIDFGHLAFKGTPDGVRSSEIVRAAYLGDPAIERPVVEVVA
jgi:ABC-type branched-subunit amino acid transport system ATPase component/branched-subunit amino acid ABC-type transport system permease component